MGAEPPEFWKPRELPWGRSRLSPRSREPVVYDSVPGSCAPDRLGIRRWKGVGSTEEAEPTAHLSTCDAIFPFSAALAAESRATMTL